MPAFLVLKYLLIWWVTKYMLNSNTQEFCKHDQLYLHCELMFLFSGGNGYINDYPTGRFLRDAKLLEIGGGTSEIRRLIIGRALNDDFRQWNGYINDYPHSPGRGTRKIRRLIIGRALNEEFRQWNGYINDYPHSLVEVPERSED